MYQVSDAYKAQVLARERRVMGRVTVDYTDPALDQSIQATANQNANVSYPSQAADGSEGVPRRYAALDGTFRPDGTWYPAPAPNELGANQMGWWGAVLAGAGGTFVAPYPTLTITYQARPVHSLRVVGDSARQEYPVDFTIKLYGAGDVLLHTEVVAANAGITWSKDIAPVLNVVKQVLEISKWSLAGRTVKVSEFFTGIRQTYEGEDLVSIDLLEEREVSQGSLPVGNISANQITVKLNNADRRFDADNPDSPLYGLIKPNRRVRAWLGLAGDGDGSQVAKSWDSLADWQAGTLPPQADVTSSPGDVKLARPVPSFTRASVAYNPETGAQVAAGTPRFGVGRFHNILPLNASNGGEDGTTAGWSSVGCTITPDGAHVKSGTRAMKIVGANNASTALAAVSAGQPFYSNRQYQYSYWVYSEVGCTARVAVAGIYAVSVVVPAGVWTRVATTNGAGTAYPDMRIYNTDGSAMWVDELQIAQGPALVDWVPGGTGQAYVPEESAVNLLAGKTDLVTGWSAFGGAVVTVTAGQSTPFGGTGAYRIQTSGGSDVRKYYATVVPSPTVVGRNYATRLWVKLRAGSPTVRVNTQFGLQDVTTTTWTEVKIVSVGDGSGVSLLLQFRGNNVSDNLDFDVFWPQVEEKSYHTTFADNTRAAEALTYALANPWPANTPATILLAWRPDKPSTDAAFFPNGAPFRRLLHLRRTTGNRRDFTFWYGQGGFRFERNNYDPGGANVVATVPAAFAAGDLVLLALRNDATGLKGFVRVQSGAISTASAAGAELIDGMNQVTVGHDSGGGAQPGGSIDTVQVEAAGWNDAQITAWMNATAAPTADRDTIFLMNADGTLTSAYPTEATIVTSPVDFSTVGQVGASAISWTADTPANTVVTVETSLDGGLSWAPASNGETVPGLRPGDDLTGKFLLARAKLSTAETSATPTLNSIKVEVRHDEWVPLGQFWATEWQAQKDTVEATVIARDRLERLRSTTYQSSQVTLNATLYDLAVAVLQDAGLAPGDYVVDPALQAITVPYAWFNPVTHREALRIIAEAGLAQVYCDRQGLIRVDGQGAGLGATPVLIITADAYFRLGNPMRPGQVANEILAYSQPLTPATVAEEVYRSAAPLSVPAGQTLQVTVTYSRQPVIEAVAALEAAGADLTITAATYYGWGAEISITNVGGAQETTVLVISGKPLATKGKEAATAKDSALQIDQGVLRYEYRGNALVQTFDRAREIASTLLASSKDSRRDIELDWRGDMALLLGDRITVAGVDYHIIRQQIDWAGALRVATTGRKVT